MVYKASCLQHMMATAFVESLCTCICIHIHCIHLSCACYVPVMCLSCACHVLVMCLEDDHADPAPMALSPAEL